eukprot:CAMPEP_0172923642 /NCGR_PEP_ID=MMETSP1075-20121228/210119_1 /TAXON_ID=2916 /ORGANISM="Ceratium fusus, Strain PA161109" /LENGTH=34 /DNA_ID= /DNA_START= /DNA_END= /DNA_ORIENTATION=
MAAAMLSTEAPKSFSRMAAVMKPIAEGLEGLAGA